MAWTDAEIVECFSFVVGSTFNHATSSDPMMRFNKSIRFSLNHFQNWGSATQMFRFAHHFCFEKFWNAALAHVFRCIYDLNTFFNVICVNFFSAVIYFLQFYRRLLLLLDEARLCLFWAPFPQQWWRRLQMFMDNLKMIRFCILNMNIRLMRASEWFHAAVFSPPYFNA